MVIFMQEQSVTKQCLLDHGLTPNHTLRRLIQSWCTLNASLGVERIPTPKSPIGKTEIVKLLTEAKGFPEKQLKCLTRLRSVAFEGQRNKTCLESVGVIEFLATTMNISAPILWGKDSVHMGVIICEYFTHLFTLF